MESNRRFLKEGHSGNRPVNSYIPSTNNAGSNHHNFGYHHTPSHPINSNKQCLAMPSHHGHNGSNNIVVNHCNTQIHSGLNNNVAIHASNTYSNIPPPPPLPAVPIAGNANEQNHILPQNGGNRAAIYNDHVTHQAMHRNISKSYQNGTNGPHYGNLGSHNQHSIYFNGNHVPHMNGMGPPERHHNHVSGRTGVSHAAIIPVAQNTYSNSAIINETMMALNNPPNGIIKNRARSIYSTPETEGLPSSLVESMRTLFDILDDTKQGKIRLSDIESRWEQSEGKNDNGKPSGAEPLIKMGVMGYLRKVTPSDGLLTFDRFCAGLRLALMANNNGNEESEKGYDFNSPTHDQNNSHHKSSLNHIGLPENSSHYQNNSHKQNPHSANFSVYGTTGTATLGNPHHPVSKSHSSGGLLVSPTVQQGGNNGSNTMGRSSKIPSLSSSKLPMPTISNNSRVANSAYVIASGIPMPHLGNPTTHKRHSEHGTTVAMVHPHPHIKPPSNNSSNITLTKNVPHSNTKLAYGKNGSLDNLKSSAEDKLPSSQKDRPPSAPLLDPTEGEGMNVRKSNQNGVTSGSTSTSRRRAKSSDREDPVGKTSGDDSKKVTFSASRQRTLSMPQLQMNKLKMKGSGVDVDNPSQPTPNIVRPQVSGGSSSGSSINGTLKFSVHKSANATSNSQSSSAIPTFSMNKIKMAHDGSCTNTSRATYSETKELPTPPPKPPRNPSNGPNTSNSNASMTIVTNMTSNAVRDGPHSGSSVGSSANSCSTLSSGNTTDSSKVMEIRKPLTCLSWQKGLTIDKKPSTQALSVANVSSTSSIRNSISNNNNINGPSSNGHGGNPKAPATSLNKCYQSNGPKAPAKSSTGRENKTKTTTKTNLRRKETSRRHTVQAGIDFSTLKRLKQLEQERDVLQQGMSYVGNASKWFNKQLEHVEEKISLLNKGAPSSEYWSDSYEERLNLLGCRVSEVNSLLAALIDGSSRLPEHMDLQIPSHLSLRTITRLKEQNRQLTQEVSDCSHRVTQLETEKAMLLRQLFHTKNALHQDETMYM